MNQAKTPPPQAIHWAIVLTAREGKVAEFEDCLVRFVQQSFADPGVTGVHLMRPAQDSTSREFLLHRSFASKEHSRQFYESEMFQRYQQEMEPLLEKDAVIRPLHGLEAFFRSGSTPPPRWKMAIVTWLAVFPAVAIMSRLISPLLEGWHPLAITAVVVSAVVVTLTWVVMPWLTGLLKFWLHRKPQEVYLKVPEH